MISRLKSILSSAFPPAPSGPPVRLVIVQGPQQFLAAISAIRHECAIENAGNVQTIAVVGHFYSSATEGAKMQSVCREIAHHCGCSRVIDVADIEQALRRRKLSFSRAVRMFRERIGRVIVQTIYVARNGQPLNELSLAAAGQHARRIAYGDGLGFVDLDKSWGERIYNPDGYVPVTEAWLTTPVEYQRGLFDRLNVVTVPAEYYADNVRLLCDRVEALRGMRQHYQELSGGAPITLCLTGPMTESKHTATIEDEMALYETTARPLMEAGQAAIVKGHPRATHGQAQKFAATLRSWGVRAAVPALELPWPAEFVSQFVTLDKVLSLCSTTGIMLAWFQRCPIQVGIESDAMHRHFLPAYTPGWRRDFRIIKLLIRQSYAGRFSETRYDDAEDPVHGFTDGSQVLRPDEAARFPMKTP